SIPEVIGFKKALFNPESSESISDKIAEALTDRDFYSLLKENALARAKEFSWKRTASKTWKLINDYCLSVRKDSCSPILKMECIREMSKAIQPFKGDKPFIRELSRCIYDIYADKKNKKSIYIDLSVLSKSDAGTGIQRVSRNIRDLLPEAASGYDVAPVRKCRTMTGYEYSRKFLNSPRCDSVIYPQRGDVLFFPELTMPQVIAQKNYLLQLKERGVKLIALIHDLMPIRHPETCQEKILSFFSDFIDIIAFFDGVICNSKATADDFEKWLAEKFPQRHGVCFIDWFHLGSEFNPANVSESLSEEEENAICELKKRNTFLMVSTIEPRKRYDQVLDAFDELWNSGADVNFVIVGRAGWRIEKLLERLNNHPESGIRLFWFSGISDAFLNRIYDAASCVIMASVAEGFGLAVIEAASYSKPLILRDIPVFREIASENAFYFDGMDGNALADCIRKWLKLYDRGEHPKSDGIKSLTWHESIKMLFDRLKKYI
ncbi:MAG: glycosyltransferase, partial [bacterium]|nr:glycosyltransferase [bacterium]